ncbi:hypothetical protein C8R47DRAFT_1228125 [Mycena vitilis]|nr:hypothetical protein C8R47DRAFT_1228125 [Mycena vitilis]
MARTVRKAKGRHKTKVQDQSELEETRRRAAKRRDISRRYYERHPEIREKNRAKMRERRQAVKVYRRQWDPPKEPRAAVSEGDDASTSYDYEAGERSTSPDTAVAHAALTTMYRMSTILHGARVPLSLAEIEGYESSGSEASDASPSAAAAERRAELAARLAVLKAARNARIAAAAAKNGDFEAGADAWMDRERAARMKIHVETSAPIEAVHQYRGSAGVETWLRAVSAE